MKNYLSALAPREVGRNHDIGGGEKGTPLRDSQSYKKNEKLMRGKH